MGGHAHGRVGFPLGESCDDPRRIAGVALRPHGDRAAAEPRDERLDVVAVAVGGSHVDSDDDDLAGVESLRQQIRDREGAFGVGVSVDWNDVGLGLCVLLAVTFDVLTFARWRTAG
jgi:hypothetical protein